MYCIQDDCSIRVFHVHAMTLVLPVLLPDILNMVYAVGYNILAIENGVHTEGDCSNRVFHDITGILSVVPPVDDMVNTLVTSLHNIINVISSTSTHVNKNTSTKPVHSTSSTLNTLKVKGQAVQLRISPLLRDNFRDLLQNE